MGAVPPLDTGHKRQAVERLVALYAAWGRPDDEARWREKLRSR